MRVWITRDRAWRVDVRDDGKWAIVEKTMPMGAGRGGLPAAKTALERLDGAPAWDDLIED